MLEPLVDLPVEVIQKALVIGGGAAGMTAALNLADQGFETFLIEQSDHLGGQALRLHQTLEEQGVQDYVNRLIDRVSLHPRIRIFLQSRVIETKGSVGQFTSRIEQSPPFITLPLRGGREGMGVEIVSVDHGVVIVAIGGSEHRPDEYLFGSNPSVKTQLDFQEILFQAA